MNTEKLKQIHERIKEHKFRLTREDWEGYYLLLKELEEEFYKCLEELHKEEKSHSEWSFFIHELRGAIWHFQFEFKGRAEIKPKEEENNRYGFLIPEFQKKINIIIENYIQQIHKFIITEIFEEFIIYYLGCENWEDENARGGRWRRYKLNKETNKCEREILK